MAESEQPQPGQRQQHGGGNQRTAEIADAEVRRIGDEIDAPPAIDKVDKTQPNGKTPQH